MKLTKAEVAALAQVLQAVEDTTRTMTLNEWLGIESEEHEERTMEETLQNLLVRMNADTQESVKNGEYFAVLARPRNANLNDLKEYYGDNLNDDFPDGVVELSWMMIDLPASLEYAFEAYQNEGFTWTDADGNTFDILSQQEVNDLLG